MSNPDQPSEYIAPEGARPDPVPVRPAPAVRESRPRGGGSLALAVLLSLIAVGAAGYVGWQQWVQTQGVRAAVLTTMDLQTRVSALETTLIGVSGERTSLNQRLNDAAAVNRSLREELLGQAGRTRNLEDAVAKLAEKSLSGHDAMLLDETDSLLRMASERYTLFHDAQGAAAAYTLADQTLAAVNDGAFSTVRQDIDVERAALEKSQPANQATALQQLTELRGTLPTLPLKSLDSPNPTQAPDLWTRIRQAVAGVFSVQRDTGAPIQLGGALTELRNLRAVHALTPTPDAAAPAASGTASPAGGAKP